MANSCTPHSHSQDPIFLQEIRPCYTMFKDVPEQLCARCFREAAALFLIDHHASRHIRASRKVESKSGFKSGKVFQVCMPRPLVPMLGDKFVHTPQRFGSPKLHSSASKNPVTSPSVLTCYLQLRKALTQDSSEALDAPIIIPT